MPDTSILRGFGGVRVVGNELVLAHNKTPMRLLTGVELATIRFRSVAGTPQDTWPNGANEVATDTAARILAYIERGLLPGLSGWDIADRLQGAFIHNGLRPRVPWRGMDILRNLDAAALDVGVAVWLSAEPAADDPHHFRKMRLSERLSELGWVA